MEQTIIPVAGPWITEKEIDYVNDALANAWYKNAGLYSRRFEQAFSNYLGVKYAISLPSCTSAIHLSLLSMEIGPGDEVIVPDLTWIATAAPISYVGATPVFADIDPDCWCMSAESLEQCITPKTRAVIPVDLYGNVPDWDEIMKVIQSKNIAIIEDAAEAVGSEHKGKKAGSFGDAGVFSFHGSKTLTTGEGGMLVTDRQDIHYRCLFLRDHGRKPGDNLFWNTEIAYKYKMSDLQAALGLAQLERIDELIKKKRQIFSWYKEELHDCPEVTLNHEGTCVKNTFWMVTVIIDKKIGLEKTKLLQLLKNHNIDCRPFFYPLSMLPAYQDSPQAREAQKRNIISYQISPYGLNLPSGFNMTRDKVKYVCDVLKTLITFAKTH